MWNYRIGTRLNKTLLKNYSEKLSRQFFVFECYYSEEGIPNGYFEGVDTDNQPNPLSDWNNLKDLKGAYKLIKEAFNKPVIDIDNFPNEYVIITK